MYNKRRGGFSEAVSFCLGGLIPAARSSAFGETLAAAGRSAHYVCAASTEVLEDSIRSSSETCWPKRTVKVNLREELGP